MFTCLVLLDADYGAKKTIMETCPIMQTGALHTMRTNRTHVVDTIFQVKVTKNFSATEHRFHMPNMILDYIILLFPSLYLLSI